MMIIATVFAAATIVAALIVLTVIDGTVQNILDDVLTGLG